MIEKELIHSLTKDFEDFSNKTDDSVEFWLARDLQHLLGYTEWRNFQNTILKAKTACEVSGQNISDHFVGVNKMVENGILKINHWLILCRLFYLKQKISQQR